MSEEIQFQDIQELINFLEFRSQYFKSKLVKKLYRVYLSVTLENKIEKEQNEKNN